jgi:hypothetical protein
MNAEWAGSDTNVLYFYSYLFKGRKKVQVTFKSSKNQDTHPDDEIRFYILARKICSSDAAWRMFGFQTYPAPSPSVTVVKVRLEATVKHFRNLNKVTAIDVYLRRPIELHSYKFTEFDEIYRIATGDQPPVCKAEIFEVNMGREFTKRVWVVKRTEVVHVSRLETIAYNAGEVWYLRLLFLRRPVLSFDDAKTHDKVVYNTFQQCATAAGYIKNK